MLSGCYAAMTCCIGRCDLSWSVARRHQLERTYVGRTNFWIAPNASWSVALTSADHETRITCMGAPFETTHEEPSAAEPFHGAGGMETGGGYADEVDGWAEDAGGAVSSGGYAGGGVYLLRPARPDGQLTNLTAAFVARR